MKYPLLREHQLCSLAALKEGLTAHPESKASGCESKNESFSFGKLFGGSQFVLANVWAEAAFIM